MTDPFEPAAPPPPREDYPRLRNMTGRLMIIEPLKVEEVPNTLGAAGATQTRITANVHVLDGGPIWFGDDPDRGISATKSKDAPCELPGMYLNGSRLVAQLTDKARGGALRARVLGRLTSVENGPGRRPSWVLTPPTDAELQVGRDYQNTRNPFG